MTTTIDDPIAAKLGEVRAEIARLRAENERLARERVSPALLATIQTAIPAIRAGLGAGGSLRPNDVQARIAARDSLHALEAAIDGVEPPAAVLSVAEAEAVRALRRWRELTITEGGAHLGEWADVLIAIDKVIEAGRPLASEGKEG